MYPLNFDYIINKIVQNKFYSFKEVKNMQQALLFNKIYEYMNHFVNHRVSSVYFRYNGKYFLYVSDGIFYYVGKKMKRNKFYLFLK